MKASHEFVKQARLCPEQFSYPTADAVDVEDRRAAQPFDSRILPVTEPHIKKSMQQTYPEARSKAHPGRHCRAGHADPITKRERGFWFKM